MSPQACSSLRSRKQLNTQNDPIAPRFQPGRTFKYRFWKKKKKKTHQKDQVECKKHVLDALHSAFDRRHLAQRTLTLGLDPITLVSTVCSSSPPAEHTRRSSGPLFIQSGGKLSRTLGKKPPVLLKTHPNDPNGKGKRRKQKWSHLKTTARIPWVEWGLPPRGASSWYCYW